jgi:hypothetical protein
MQNGASERATGYDSDSQGAAATRAKLFAAGHVKCGGASFWFEV